MEPTPEQTAFMAKNWRDLIRPRVLEIEERSETYGKFSCEPLERGFGTTLGTGLRRVLLSSLQGAAITHINIEGALGDGVVAKDVILALIARIGVAGATGHAIEYAGTTVRGLSMESRLTLCNMSIEAGGRAGFIAPDETTFAYLHGRPYAPAGAAWDQAVDRWRHLASDPDAVFDREMTLDASRIEPMVTWGTTPEDALPISGRVPDPDAAAKEIYAKQGLDYRTALWGLLNLQHERKLDYPTFVALKNGLAQNFREKKANG